MLNKLKIRVQQIYNEEKQFITNSVFNLLPESARQKLSDGREDEYIIDSDEEPKKKNSLKRAQFQEKQKEAKTQRSYSHEDLKARLHNKIAELSKQREEKSAKSIRKKKSKAKKNEELKAKKKTFTSQSNPNLVNQNQGKKSSNSSNQNNPLAATPDTSLVKTPLQKKPVKKTNGEIVYSKFDFISDGRKTLDFMQGKPPSSTKPEDVLKSVEKHQLKIHKLKSQGKVSAAVIAVDKQKWNNALQRAKGTKVRDDPTLLKKTIKKQDKIKQAKQKKWQERIDLQEKLKEKKQAKRQSNIQAKKDEKVKRNKKILRKRGRII